jgi:hypothetical protein|tara:strand:+ start:2541 stop:3905 length:1365 start_codon:yes stop_codon:yes gene_type:complete
MFNPRYLYNSSAMADKLHNTYRSEWATDGLPKRYTDKFEEAYKFWPNRDDKDYIRRAIVKGIRVLDPNMQFCTLPADDTHNRNIRYQDIPKDIVPKKLRKIILDMTMPGVMGEVIEYTKNNQDRSYADPEHSSLIQRFATPTSEYYHDKFAKDLWKVAPRGWKEKKLETKEEKYEMLELWMRQNAKLDRPPNVKDHWVVPKGHRLYEYYVQGFRILPAPGTIWRHFNGVDQAITMLLPQIKKGNKPNGWGTFKYHHPEEAEAIEKKYPEVLCKSKHWRDNLTPKQQKNVDKWNDFLTLVKRFPKLPMPEWWDKLNKKERYLIGNHAKYLGSKWSLHGEQGKIAKWLKPIAEEASKLRPDLYDWYVNKNKHGTSPLRHLYKNQETQSKLLHLADAGKPRPTGSMSYALSSFTRSNSKYPDFDKKIRKLRPEWFDQEAIRKATWKRFHAKRKSKNK